MSVAARLAPGMPGLATKKSTHDEGLGEIAEVSTTEFVKERPPLGVLSLGPVTGPVGCAFGLLPRVPSYEAVSSVG